MLEISYGRSVSCIAGKNEGVEVRVQDVILDLAWATFTSKDKNDTKEQQVCKRDKEVLFLESRHFSYFRKTSGNPSYSTCLFCYKQV